MASGKRGKNRKQRNAGGARIPAGEQSVTVRVTPIEGEPTEQSVAVADAATVGGVLNALGLSADRKNLMLGGKPASVDDSVKAGDVIGVEERPQGS